MSRGRVKQDRGGLGRKGTEALTWDVAYYLNKADLAEPSLRLVPGQELSMCLE